MSEQQFQQLMQQQTQQFQQMIQQQAQGGAGVGGGQVAGAAAVVGPMPPCQLGKDKIRRYKKWSDWIRDAENKMKFLQMTTDDQKSSFVRSCAGPELTKFWAKEARIRFEPIEEGGERQEAHTYKEMMQETAKTMLKLVSRDRAIIDMLRMEQGSRSFMDFLSEVEDQEHLCRTEEERITGNDLKRMSLLAGLKDRTLAEKALAEEYSLKQIIQAAVNRESSKANVEAMQARPSHNVHRVEDREQLYQGGDLDAKINHLHAELAEVMKVRQSGKYSSRFRREDGKEPGKEQCPRCTYQHGEGARCPAEGQECNNCGKLGHFDKSRMCTKNKKKAARRVKEVKEEPETTEDSGSEEEEEVCRIVRRSDTISRARHQSIRHITKERSEGVRQGKAGPSRRCSRWVTITMGGKEVKLYCDTGSNLTIIPPDLYKPSMGKVVAARSLLRAWGSNKYLDTKGMFRTTLVTTSGARKETWVYVVAGARPEPLQGDHDAADLGIVTFHPEGRRKASGTSASPRG